MPKSLQFSPKEVVEVWKLKAEGKAVLQILLTLNRSTRGVYSVLKHETQFKNMSNKTILRENEKLKDWQ